MGFIYVTELDKAATYIPKEVLESLPGDPAVRTSIES
jgi:hypothetical protein